MELIWLLFYILRNLSKNSLIYPQIQINTGSAVNKESEAWA